MASARVTPTGSASRISYGAFSVTVTRITRLGGDFVRITLGGRDLEHFHSAGFDQRIKLIFPLDDLGHTTFPRTENWYGDWRALPEHERCAMRTYTVRAHRRDLGELDIDFVVHGDTGPATRWVNRAVIGDELVVVGPDARSLVAGDTPVGGVEFHPGEARRILLAGDETAAPAICSIVESLPRDAMGQVFIEVATADDILPLVSPGRVTVSWLARDARPGLAHGDVVSRAVRCWIGEMIAPQRSAPGAEPDDRHWPPEVDVDSEMLWDVPALSAVEHDVYAWIAGEAGFITELRRFLVRDAGMHRHDVAFMGYWRRGRSEN